MDNVIHIKLYQELDSPAKNKLRVRLDMGRWLGKWRKAKETNDYEAMDRLDREYEMVGLP